MSTRYQYFQKMSLALDLPDPDGQGRWEIPADGELLIPLIHPPIEGFYGLLADVPFHTTFEGGLILSLVGRGNLQVSLGFIHRWSDITFTTWRDFHLRVPAGGAAEEIPLSDYSSISLIPRGITTDDIGTVLDVDAERLVDGDLALDMVLRFRGFASDSLDVRQREFLDIIRLENRTAVSFWQLYATVDRPPISPPGVPADDDVDDMGTGASGALLRLQRAMVTRFASFAAGAEGIEDAFARYGIPVPNPPPDPVLYDEPRSGSPAFFRIGNASVDVETGDDRLLWSISQEIEAHVDPVRGRAAVLAMGDVIERAFAPRSPDTGDHGLPGLRVEEWLGHAALSLPDSPADVWVSDFVQTDSRIGYSEAGLTYQVIVTYDVVMSPL